MCSSDLCGDADIARTVNLMVQHKFRNAGQACLAPTRFFMDRRIYGDFVDAFGAATQALRVGSHSYARALFREYVVRYPTDERADDAQYGVGQSYLQQNQPAAALGEFRRILTTYRTGDVMDKTLADMAEAFVLVRACADARQSLEALIAAYPESSLITRARNRLREISRLPARACAE